MALPDAASSDSTGQGATPETPDTTVTTAASDSRAESNTLELTLAKERDARKAAERELRELRKAQEAATAKAHEEQGNYKALYEQHRAALEKANAEREALNARWRDAQTSAALSSALGAQVVEGSTPHVMTALSAALSVDDDGAVSVDLTKLGQIRTAKALDATKVRDVQTLVSEFLAANPFFAASKAAGGSGSGGIGPVNGGVNVAGIMQNWHLLTEDQRKAYTNDPKFYEAVVGKPMPR